MAPSVLLAMSGGIDSSAAAVMLLGAGYDVHGLTFRIDGVTSDSVTNAGAICQKLGISHQYIDITDRFRNEVIGYFLDEYSRGRTPNPCVRCNKAIKFGDIYDFAMMNGFDYISTGHYASITSSDGRYYLEKAVDAERDQSYFLYVLKEEQLSRILFPLNGVKKSKSRQICADAELMPHDSKESREICFIKENYRDYLENEIHIEAKDGFFIDEDGNQIARHGGIHRYTLGQRKGLGLSMGRPVFITAINPDTADISIGAEDRLFKESFWMENVNIINGSFPKQGNFYVKIRYGAEPAGVDGFEFSGNGRIKVRLMEKARAITPGQSAVIYDGVRVVGGGTII